VERRASGPQRASRRALEIHRSALPPDHPEVTDSAVALGRSLVGQARFPEAEGLLLEAASILEKRGDAAHERLHGVLRELTALYDTWGKPEEAARHRARLR